jgi:hypothetical protein
VRAAATRGARAVAARLRAEIDERTDALTRPIAESERRIDALRACALGAERSLGDLHHLMAGEEQRLALRLEQRQDAFLAPAMAHAEAGLGRRLGGLRLRRGALRREAFRAAQDVHRELVEGWRVEEVPAAERLYADGMERFVSLANAAVRDATLAAGGAAPPPLVPEAGIGVRTRLYYTELLYLTGRSPLRWVVDLLRSPAAARRAVRREAARYLRRLLVTNGSRVTHDLVEQAGDGRRRLEAEVAACLRGAHERAARALADARERTARGAGEAGAELARLRELRRRVADLDAGLACVAAGERQVAT